MIISFVFIMLNYINFDDIVQSFVDSTFRQIKTFQNSYQAVQSEDEGSKGGFMLSGLDQSVSALAKNAPMVIGSSLFRPFPWESKKIIIFLSSLEALFMLLMTLYILFKTRIYGFFIYTFGNSLLLFCFLFSILFASR